MEERTLCKSLYKVTMTLIAKPDQVMARKGDRSISLTNIEKA